MKVTDRDQGAAQFLRHLRELRADLTDIHQVSQGWTQTSRATALLKAIDRETTQLEAHIIALAREVNTMDSVCHEMRGGITVNTLQELKKKEVQQPQKAKTMVQSSTKLKTVSPQKFLDLQRARHGLPTSTSTQVKKLEGAPSSSRLSPVPPPSAIRSASPSRLPKQEMPRQARPFPQEPDKNQSSSRVTNVASGLPANVLAELKKSGMK